LLQKKNFVFLIENVLWEIWEGAIEENDGESAEEES